MLKPCPTSYEEIKVAEGLIMNNNVSFIAELLTKNKYLILL
ncbi:MAG: hypothetical protein JETT_1395 [Candidatus Jettenia ecosi]|uniref:Uncharacterized protein n=1 Tax=Candidatus Jettenia ecosi TaxID=2494326 RepID=A0A533QNY9_9BACT|nr:MAG: hypothetical protein JETT_1395 [Candidatus Jettenia ecosi]